MGRGNADVLALGRWGAGHWIAWCDSTTLAAPLSAFDARYYLGQRNAARVASFGYSLCRLAAGSAASQWVQYLGDRLPDRYRGDAAALASDWDALIYCGWVPRGGPREFLAAELREFVTRYGRGLMVSMDYGSAARQSIYDPVNELLAETGVSFVAVTTDVAWSLSACVPGAR